MEQQTKDSAARARLTQVQLELSELRPAYQKYLILLVEEQKLNKQLQGNHPGFKVERIPPGVRKVSGRRKGSHIQNIFESMSPAQLARVEELIGIALRETKKEGDE